MQTFLAILTFLAITTCVLRFAYRIAFEGKPSLAKPQSYRQMRQKLDIYAGVGVIAATLLIWWQTHWWIVLIWIAFYMGAEVFVTDKGEKRFLNDLVELIKRNEPDATTEELLRQAHLRLDFEKKANATEQEYL